MPEREDDHLTPATRLLEKRREMAEVEQALAAQKEVHPSLFKHLYYPLYVNNSYNLSLGMQTENSFISRRFIFYQEFQMKMESLQQRREELERKADELFKK